MATVTLDKINKVYPNGFHAIHDLDLEIADTEFSCSSARQAAASPPHSA